MTSQLRTMFLSTGVKHQYHAHCGAKAQLRNLRHKCASILKQTDSQSVTVRRRAFEATKDEPNPEYGRLHLMAAALDAADQTGESWVTCLHYFLERFEAQEAPSATA